MDQVVASNLLYDPHKIADLPSMFPPADTWVVDSCVNAETVGPHYEFETSISSLSTFALGSAKVQALPPPPVTITLLGDRASGAENDAASSGTKRAANSPADEGARCSVVV